MSASESASEWAMVWVCGLRSLIELLSSSSSEWARVQRVSAIESASEWAMVWVCGELSYCRVRTGVSTRAACRSGQVKV
jgi:hypothetical protein